MSDSEQKSNTSWILPVAVVGGAVLFFKPLMSLLTSLGKLGTDAFSAVDSILNAGSSVVGTIWHTGGSLINDVNPFSSSGMNPSACAGMFVLKDGTMWSPLLNVNTNSCDQDWSQKNWVTKKTKNSKWFTKADIAAAVITTPQRIGRDDVNPSTGEYARLLGTLTPQQINALKLVIGTGTQAPR
jgi:hypothetical protein